MFICSSTQENKAQGDEVEEFKCAFSGCVDTELVCNCTVPNGTLFWWDGNTSFCSKTFLNLNNSGKPNRDGGFAEVIRSDPSGSFNSLLRVNVSIGLNGTEIGCSHEPINTNTCRPSITDRNSTFKLLVTNLDCQESSGIMNVLQHECRYISIVSSKIFALPVW